MVKPRPLSVPFLFRTSVKLARLVSPQPLTLKMLSWQWVFQPLWVCICLFLCQDIIRKHGRMRPRPVELLNKAMVWGDTEMVFSCWWLLAVWIGFPRPGLIGCQANEHPGHIYGRPRAQETPDDRALNPHCLTHVVIPSHLEKREPRSDRSNRQRELWSAEQESRCFLFPGRASRTVEVGKPSSPLRAVEAPSCLGSVADLWTSIRCHGRTCNTPSPSSSWHSSLLFAFFLFSNCTTLFDT